MRRLSILGTFLLLSSAFCWGQLNHFEYLSPKDGLSNPSVNAFYEDEYGRMWIATRNGLNCYDGHSFRVFGIQNGINDTYIRSIAGDKKGYLLIQTRTQVFWMSLHSEVPSPIFSSHTSVAAIAGNENGLWIASSDTLYSVEKGDTATLRPIIASAGITAILPTSKHYVWVASNEGVRLYKDSSPTTLFKDIQHVSWLYEDNQQTLWVCTRNNGLFQCSYQHILAHYTNDQTDFNSLIDNDVRCITQDKAGNYWVGLYGGLCRLEPRSGIIHRYEYDPRAEHSLSTFSVLALTTDMQGTVWIGTYFGSIMLINPQYAPYTYIGAFGRDGHRLSNPIVTCACADNKRNLWIGTNGGGLNYYDRTTGKMSYYRLNAEDPQYAIKAMWLDSDSERLWIATHRSGLKWLDTRSSHPSFHDIVLPESNLRQLIPYGDSLIVLTQHSIYVASRQTGHYRPLVPRDIMPEIRGELSDMVLHGGMVWFARANDLYAYPYRSSQADEVQHYQLPANVVTLFADSLNGLLVGTDSYGVIQKTDTSFIPLAAINEVLSSPYIMDIKSSESSFIIATDQGIYLSDIRMAHCHPLSYSDKFPIEAIVEHSCAVIGSEVCVGGVNGMILYSLEEKIKSFTPVSLHLCHLQAGNQFIPSPLAENGITLQPSDNILSFVITAAGFITRNDYRVRFRLRGYEKNWTETRNNAQCSYSNLPSGNYTLEVECVDTDLKQSFSVRVLPHWYASWWAWLGYSLISIGLLTWGFISFIRYIERRAKRKLSEAYQQELLKATNIVMNHLADSEFNIERFAREMLVSRTKLFEKIQQISGQTPNEFILGIRMREAANMLRTKPELSILDVSILVGFNSCSYFTKCFHHHFGVSPTAWRKSGK